MSDNFLRSLDIDYSFNNNNDISTSSTALYSQKIINETDNISNKIYDYNQNIINKKPKVINYKKSVTPPIKISSSVSPIIPQLPITKKSITPSITPSLTPHIQHLYTQNNYNYNYADNVVKCQWIVIWILCFLGVILVGIYMEKAQENLMDCFNITNDLKDKLSIKIDELNKAKKELRYCQQYRNELMKQNKNVTLLMDQAHSLENKTDLIERELNMKKYDVNLSMYVYLFIKFTLYYYNRINQIGSLKYNGIQSIIYIILMILSQHGQEYSKHLCH